MLEPEKKNACTCPSSLLSSAVQGIFSATFKLHKQYLMIVLVGILFDEREICDLIIIAIEYASS